MPSEQFVRHFWAATDLVDPIHDYNIPIPQHKLPPSKDDFPHGKRRRREHGEEPVEHHEPVGPKPDGHVDEYA